MMHGAGSLSEKLTKRDEISKHRESRGVIARPRQQHCGKYICEKPGRMSRIIRKTGQSNEEGKTKGNEGVEP